MAPKRPAPPPPPVESSEETDSGSGSEESEEEIALSPPTATAPKNTVRPPPQPEASDESSEEEEDESEEEDEEEEEEALKSNYTAPPTANPNPPPPPPTQEESESDEEGEESESEEEANDDAPQKESASKLAAEANGEKLPPSSGDNKRGGFFQRSWSKDDEVRILETLAAHRREHGTLPHHKDLEAALAGSLDNSDYRGNQLLGKVKSLRSVYSRTVKKGELPSKDHDRRIFNLSKEVWGSDNSPADHTVMRNFEEMCKLYPFFSEEAKALEKTHPGLLKREFGVIDDEKARVLEQKIKKQRLMQMKVELRRHDLTKELTKALMDLVQ